MEALYFEIQSAPKFYRPPKGVTPKHLVVWVIHCMITGSSFENYGSMGGTPTGFSKSFLRPRPPDEMKELAIEFYQTLVVISRMSGTQVTGVIDHSRYQQVKLQNPGTQHLQTRSNWRIDAPGVRK